MRYPLTCPSRLHRPGYTLVELLLVLAILGLASAIVVPHMLAPGTMGVQSATRIIVTDLIFAQNDAMARQAVRRVVFDHQTDSYRITDAAGTSIDAPWKSGNIENYVVSFADDSRFRGVEILSVNFGGDQVIEFDDLGAPDSGGTIELRYRDHRYRIHVAEFTGRITVQKINPGG